MKNSITVTPGAVAAFRDAVAMVDDTQGAERHDRAVRRYREERRVAEGVADEPWWIDVGGEGGSC